MRMKNKGFASVVAICVVICFLLPFIVGSGGDPAVVGAGTEPAGLIQLVRETEKNEGGPTTTVSSSGGSIRRSLGPKKVLHSSSPVVAGSGVEVDADQIVDPEEVGVVDYEDFSLQQQQQPQQLTHQEEAARVLTMVGEGGVGSTTSLKRGDVSKYGNLVLGKKRATNLNNLPNPSPDYNGDPKPFKFHIYDIPERYIEGALKLLEDRWPNSYCNRHKTKKTNYTLLDWRHAHSLFTVDVYMTRFLRFHPHHTSDPNEADVFIIPMMTHLYNCAGLMHYTNEILSWVSQFPYYKALQGHDHYYFWWRWGMHFGSVNKFWKKIRGQFPNANIISFDYLELMGRNEFQDFTLALKPRFHQSQHWIVMPYPDFSPYLVEPVTMPHKDRSIFFYFAGTASIGGIRRWIKRNCESNPNDCVFADFATSVIHDKRLGVPQEYPKAMQKSVFCGHAAGDALSSRRPTSAVLAGCIPVLICDLCLYAWENIVDYQQFAVFVHEDDVLQGRLFTILRAIPEATIKTMQSNLLKVRSRFVYNTQGPPNSGDAMDSLVDQLAVRGQVLRQYKRWFYLNDQVSADQREYPLDPKPVKRYLRAGNKGDEKDFNNLQGGK